MWDIFLIPVWWIWLEYEGSSSLLVCWPCVWSPGSFTLPQSSLWVFSRVMGHNTASSDLAVNHPHLEVNCPFYRLETGYLLQVTPASSTWPQLVFPHPENLHSWIESSIPTQATSSIQINPVPKRERKHISIFIEQWTSILQKNKSLQACLLLT